MSLVGHHITSDQFVPCCLSPIFLLKFCLLKALHGLLSNLTGVHSSRQKAHTWLTFRESIWDLGFCWDFLDNTLQLLTRAFFFFFFFLNLKDLCGEGNGTPLQYFAWKIPWMEEPGRLQSMGLLRVGHDWATSLSLFTFMPWRRKWQPTPVFLPGESQGQGSLVGCRLWGRTESDTTEAT